jgi:hypothetical protein
MTLLTDFADGVHDPLAELTKVFVERKRGSDGEPLHDRELVQSVKLNRLSGY